MFLWRNTGYMATKKPQALVKSKRSQIAVTKVTQKESKIVKEVVDKNKNKEKDSTYTITLEKAQKDSNVEIEHLDELTPSFAQDLLDNTPSRQRRLRASRVEQYASDILAGRWRSTAEAIRLNSNLELIDGQHRCAAVVKAGKPIKDVVIAILHDPKAYEGIDQAAARSLGDARRMAGLATAEMSVLSGIVYSHFNCRPTKASLAQRQEILNSFPWLEELKTVCTNKVPTSGMVAALIDCMKVDKSRAMSFFSAVFQNKPMVDGEYCEMARLLSTWIYTVKSEPRIGKSAESWKRECYVRCIRAWNAMRRGETLKKLQYKPTEDIPMPI